jgi:hypothetical protein
LKIRFLGAAAILLLAAVVYFQTSGDDTVTDSHPESVDTREADPDPVVIPAVQLKSPTYGFLCEGRFSVNVPGDEQEYPEAFAVQLDEAESEAVVEGLWPSPQFLHELEPLYWEFLPQKVSAVLTLTGVGFTDETSLTSTVSIDQATGEYGIFWSVFPVGFQTPVEFWSSAGRCESFGMSTNE